MNPPKILLNINIFEANTTDGSHFEKNLIKSSLKG